MPSLSKYTQWKVIGGYSLLFLLSILAAVLIYKQIIELIVSEENSDNPKTGTAQAKDLSALALLLAAGALGIEFKRKKA